MTRIYLTVLVLLLAAFVRLWHSGDAPPGLQHDEIFKAIEGVRVVEDADIRLFYPSNQGHEGGYVWFIGLAYALLGDSVMMIKFPAFVFGMLTIALLYRVAADLYGHRVGVIAAGLAAVSFWAIFTSRVGLRAVSLPTVTLLVIWGLIRLHRHPSWTTALATGFALGFASYTYTSSIALYPAFAVYVVFQRATFRHQWRYLAVIAIIGGLLTLPMIAIRLEDNIGSNRIDSISRPWIEFQNGNPNELIDNAWKLAGMPVFTGDPEWRYNIAERPLFPVLPGLLVYAGVLILLWRVRRQPFNAMLLVLLLAGLVPSLLTVSAPSYLRSIITLPTIMIAIALAVDAIPDKRIVWGLGIAMIGITAAADFPAYFDRWANHDAVFAIYRDDLEQLARNLRQNDPDIALVSIDDAELDPLIFYSYATPDTNMVFFDGLTNIVLSHEPTLLFVSPVSPITPPHADWLTAELGAEVLPPLLRQDGEIAFHVYRVGGPALQERIETFSQEPVYTGQPTAFIEAEPLVLPVNFGDIIELVAVDVPRRQIARENDGVNIQLYLAPIQGRLDLPLNIYVHLLDAQGEVVAQRDLLGVRPNMWDTRTVFMQDNYVIGGSLEPGRYVLAMGVYNWDTMERLPVIGHDVDQILITEIEVR